MRKNKQKTQKHLQLAVKIIYSSLIYAPFTMEELFSHKNFIELSKEVQEVLKNQKWTNKYGAELLKFIVKLGFFTLVFLFFSQKGVFFKISGMAVLSFVYYSIAITGIHESSHGSFVKSTKGNKRWGHFFSDFWAGQSSVWWHHHDVEEGYWYCLKNCIKYYTTLFENANQSPTVQQ